MVGCRYVILLVFFSSLSCCVFQRSYDTTRSYHEQSFMPT